MYLINVDLFAQWNDKIQVCVKKRVKKKCLDFCAVLTFDATAQKKSITKTKRRCTKKSNCFMDATTTKAHTEVQIVLAWVFSFVQRINVQRKCHSKHVLCLCVRTGEHTKLRRRWLLNIFTSWQSNWNENRRKKNERLTFTFIYSQSAHSMSTSSMGTSLTFLPLYLFITLKTCSFTRIHIELNWTELNWTELNWYCCVMVKFVCSLAAFSSWSHAKLDLMLNLLQQPASNVMRELLKFYLLFWKSTLSHLALGRERRQSSRKRARVWKNQIQFHFIYARVKLNT